MLVAYHNKLFAIFVYYYSVNKGQRQLYILYNSPPKRHRR